MAEGVQDGCGAGAGSCEAANDRPPLVALMSSAQWAFEAEFDRRLASSEHCSLSLAHSRNILRHLGGGPIRASELTALAGVSKQAVSQQLAQLHRNGYVTIDPDLRDHRARLVGLTDRGRRAQAMVRRLFVEIEDDWVAAMGPRGADLRPALLALFDVLRTTPTC